MEVKDFPRCFRINPSKDILIDDILEPMVEGKPTDCGKAVQNVEKFYSSCPSELDGAKDIMENKENSLYLFVRRNRMSTNGKKVSRAAKGGSWRARDKSEEITTKTGIKAKKGVYEYTPKKKSEERGVKWIMEEYVLDRGENVFEDYALCKLRVARSGKRKQGEEPGTSGKKKKHAKKHADNAAEEKDRHGGRPKKNPPLQIQTNPPLPIENCSQETSDTGSHLLLPDASELDMELWSSIMENGMYDTGSHLLLPDAFELDMELWSGITENGMYDTGSHLLLPDAAELDIELWPGIMENGM